MSLPAVDSVPSLGTLAVDDPVDLEACPAAPAVTLTETIGEVVPPEVAWIDNEHGNSLIADIAELQASHPDEIVGQYDDHARQVVVVISSPEGVSGAVTAALTRLSESYDIPVETIAGCFSRAELVAAEASFHELLLSSAPEGVSGGLDNATARLLILAEEGTSGVAWAEATAAELGPIAIVGTWGGG